MINSFNRALVALGASAVLALASGSVHAQIIINDTLTGGHSLFNWLALDGACLTAGDNSNTPSDGTQYTPTTAALTIPKCDGLNYYTSKSSTLVGGATGTGVDAAGSGALRLTNGDYMRGSNGDNQTGAVISNFTFPTNRGVQVTWTSVTYGGDNNQNTGADGISFFLSDGSKSPITSGALGGSLGYSCSNVNGKYEGLLGGYLGVGIDEFGNFTNGATGTTSSTKGDNTASGTGAHAGSIGVRGAGDITWYELNRLYPSYYPSSTSAANQKLAVMATCQSGHLYNTAAQTYNTSTATLIPDYNYLTSSILPAGVKIANQQASGSASASNPNVSTRGAAVPITYALKITSNGLLDFSYSVNSGATTTVLSGFDIAHLNGTLPSSFRFGFSAGTGGGNNVHEITCFKAAPADASNSSAGSNVQQSAQVLSGSQVFLAYYHPVNWWGSLSANNLIYDAATDTLSAASSANWDANCVLTGGSCPAISGTSTITVQSSRVILSNDGGSAGGTGVAFTAAGLSAAELTALGDTTTSAPRIAYLRGDRSNEVGSGTGAYRIRTGVLGDIVDSSPVWVGFPSSAYSGTWKDKLNSSATFGEGTSYATFKSGNATRQNVLYVGSNDGMLHGFAAGSFAAPVGSAAPVFDATSNNGKELIAYVPALVAATIHSSTDALDFSNPSYTHNFFVDATPGTGDLFYNGAWHTWLIGGLGAGGHVGGAIDDNTQVIAQPVGSLFALDITDPSATNFTEAHASSLVIGDWTSSTLTCGAQYTPTACGIHLGQTLGTPLIRRLHDGSWGVIFGNGTNSYGGGTAATAGHSGLFIMHVASDGTKTFQYIDAGAGPHGGIVQVSGADLDGDHITDYVYGGDVLGNLYRFDLTSSSSTTWSSMKIFTTASGQPITTAPAVTAIPGIGTAGNKILIAFGTGQKLPVTLTSAEVFASGSQALYGIWDANMTAWNATTTDTKYAALTQSSASTPVAITSSLLTSQTVTASGTSRVVSNNAVCWAGASVCASGNDKMGWILSLPTSTEQAIYNPLVSNGDFFVNTTIPATSSALTCGATPVAGWTMGLSLSNGGAGSTTAFASGVSGSSMNGTGTPAIYVVGNSTFLGTNTNNNGGGTNASGGGGGGSGSGDQFQSDKLNPQPGVGTRLTWTKMR
jgi:type IV pilus assembly protein PilY1